MYIIVVVNIILIIIYIHSYVVIVTFYYYVYVLLYIAIDQVAGVTLTCELMDLFDHYCTVMWNVSVYVYMHTHLATIIICYICSYTHATVKLVFNNIFQ